MDRASLHHDVACLQVDDRVVQLHVDLTGDDDDVVDRVRPVVTRRQTGRELDDSEDRSVLQRRADLSQALIGLAIVVRGKTFGGPDVTDRCSRPAREDVLRDFVDLDG